MSQPAARLQEPSPIQEKAMSEIHGLKRVLFVGQEPETVDFSDPALPPGFDAEKIHTGIAVGMRQMAERGWQADLCLVRPKKSAVLCLIVTSHPRPTTAL